MANEKLVDIILNPTKGVSEELRMQLGLGDIPPAEELRSEIEEQILTPKDDLLAQSLDEYQIHWM